jgi:zinc D-Ala-D-Ala carboxypeptidase
VKLTDHFSYEELTKSDTAARNGWDNTPPEEAKKELYTTATILEKVRTLAGNVSLHVISGYRSPQVNGNIKGSSNTSQHCKGQAADFYVDTMNVEELFQLIAQSAIRYDQLIQEYGQWVHISQSNKPRRQRYYATYNPIPGGKPIYTPA